MIHGHDISNANLLMYVTNPYIISLFVSFYQSIAIPWFCDNIVEKLKKICCNNTVFAIYFYISFHEDFMVELMMRRIIWK